MMIHCTKNPQQKAVCSKTLTMSPKKPNSANRRVAVTVIAKLSKKLTAKIPGIGHSLQQYSTVLLKPAKARDLVGVKHSVIRGKYDLLGVVNRKTSRSAYGVKLATS